MTQPQSLPECSKPELRLVIWPDESLKVATGPFPEQNLGTRLVKDTAGAMIRAMYKHYGVGLAAPQVGVPFQIFVMDASWVKTEQKRPRVFLNPRITGVGGGAQEVPHPGEGCLSFPYGYRHPIHRHDRVELEYCDFKGELQHEWFEGYESIVIQHEIDHLLGFCFIDRLSRMNYNIAIRKARKTRKQYRDGYKKGLAKMKNFPRTPEGALAHQQDWEKTQREAK